MSWVCNLTRTAERELTRLPKAMQRRIALSIDEMEHDPFQGDVRPLRGEWQGFFRKRVGRYCIIFRIDTEQHTIDIVAVRPRGSNLLVRPPEASKEGKGYGEMRKMLTGLSMIFVLSAVTLAHSKLVDIKRFVNCAVGTEVDDATKVASPRLICLGKSDNSRDRAVVILACTREVFATILQAGIQSHTAETIDVAYRFDKEKPSTELWSYTNNRAVNLVKGVHHRFAERIVKAQKLVFGVGKEAGSVNLTGSADAVTEYKKRCSALERSIK